MSRIAAFFDLDRTLLSVNSGSLYVKAEYRAGRISARQLMESFFWLGLYHLSLLDVERAYRKALNFYRGANSRELEERTGSFFAREVRQHLQPGAAAALEWHREQGHPVVLLTSSSCYLARLSSQEFRLDGWLANIFLEDSTGCLTGDFEAPLCYGAGKVIWAERWASENDVDLDVSWFYTDSLSDLPMLQRVSEPRVVNPDPRLRRVARKKNWPILDWAQA